MRYWKIQHSFKEHGVSPQANTLFLRHVLVFQYRTKMITVCIFSHDCPKKCTVVMTDDHKVVNRRRSVNSIHLLYSMYAPCIHVVQRSAVLADTDIRTSHSENTTSECENQHGQSRPHFHQCTTCTHVWVANGFTCRANIERSMFRNRTYNF